MSEIDYSGHKLKAWLDGIKRQVRRNDDEVILVTGGERKGKSALAFECALYLEGKNLDPERQFHWRGGEYMEASHNLGKYRVMVGDEINDAGTSVKFMTKGNTEWADYWTTCGYLNQIHFLNYPNLKWVTPVLSKHRSRYNLHVHRRFKDHAVASLKLLRDEDLNVYDRPKTLFTFAYPAPFGPKWAAVERRKATYARTLGVQDSGVRDQLAPVVDRLMRSA